MTLPPCPWCGDEPEDPEWEWTSITAGGGDHLVTACASCYKPIQINRLVTVTYTVEQVEEPT